MLKSTLFLLGIIQIILSAPQPPAEHFTRGLLQALPWEQIKEISQAHLKSDLGFQAGIIYLKSPKWKAIIDATRSDPDWISYKKFMNESDIDLDRITAQVEHCINMTDISTLNPGAAVPNFTSFMDELKSKSLLPVLIYMGKVKEFAARNDEASRKIARLESPEYKQLVDKTFSKPAVVEMMNELNKIGIDVLSPKSTLSILSEMAKSTTKAA